MLQRVNCYHTLETVHAASPGGQTLAFRAVLELSQRQCGWSTNPRFGVNASLFFFPSFYSHHRLQWLTLQIFKATLQFIFF
jgi:hypothetical protein